MAVIQIVIDVLSIVPKTLEDLEIRGRVETVQTTELLRSTRILRKVLETWRCTVTQTAVENHQLTVIGSNIDKSPGDLRRDTVV